MATSVRTYPETSDSRHGSFYQKIEFGPTGYNSFSTYIIDFNNGILLLEGVRAKNPQYIIQLLTGCFKKDSNINIALSELLEGEHVKAIVISINDVPVMVSCFNHNYSLIFSEWKKGFQTSHFGSTL